jgi:hypothetical protein
MIYKADDEVGFVTSIIGVFLAELRVLSLEADRFPI